MDLCLIAAEPCNRADAAGRKQQTVGISSPRAVERAAEKRREGDSRQVVVGQRWMANMCREENFLLCFSGQKAFAVGEMAVLVRGIDQHLVFTVRERCELVLAQTEA